MNLYASGKQAFDADEEVFGLELAIAASVLLVNATSYWEAIDLNEQLGHAMRSRAVIEQAKGVLMAQTPTLTAEKAFDVMRRASQRENVKLRDIAQRVMDRRALHG